jgi:hypothetical protein
MYLRKIQKRKEVIKMKKQVVKCLPVKSKSKAFSRHCKKDFWDRSGEIFTEAGKKALMTGGIVFVEHIVNSFFDSGSDDDSDDTE